MENVFGVFQNNTIISSGSTLEIERVCVVTKTKQTNNLKKGTVTPERLTRKYMIIIGITKNRRGGIER